MTDAPIVPEEVETKPAEAEKPKLPKPIPVFDHEPEHNKPRFMVVGGRTFVAQVEGDEFRIDMRLPTELVETFEGDLFNQFRQLCAYREDAELPKRIAKLDFIDSDEMVGEFFRAYAEKQQARLGESSGSSVS